jgi:hypothetical protein
MKTKPSLKMLSFLGGLLLISLAEALFNSTAFIPTLGKEQQKEKIRKSWVKVLVDVRVFHSDLEKYLN